MEGSGTADMKQTLTTSANLSYDEQERNIEFGTLIKPEHTTRHLEEVVTLLIVKRIFKNVWHKEAMRIPNALMNKQRHIDMSQIQGKDTRTEEIVGKYLSLKDDRYSKNTANIPLNRIPFFRNNIYYSSR